MPTLADDIADTGLKPLPIFRHAAASFFAYHTLRRRFLRLHHFSHFPIIEPPRLFLLLFF